VAVSDVALVGASAGAAYLAGIPLHGSPDTSLPMPTSPVYSESLTSREEGVWAAMGGRGLIA
jgi:hypothetical protein